MFIPDPESRARRRPRSRTARARIAVGGRVGEPYEVSPWETSTAAGGARRPTAIPSAAADLMAEALAEHPGRPGVLYDAACFEALAGRREAALEHLSRRPRSTRTRFASGRHGDSDLDALRDDPAFPRA